MIKILRAPIEICRRSDRREAERATALSLVRDYFGQETRISHRDDGAPYIEGRSEYVSVSHCRGECVVAVSDLPVGIDIESRRPRLLKIASRFLTSREHRVVKSRGEMDDDASIDLLLRYWTAKEAVFKCASVPDLVISEIEIFPDESIDTAYALTRDHRFRVTYSPGESGNLIALAERL